MSDERYELGDKDNGYMLTNTNDKRDLKYEAELDMRWRRKVIGIVIFFIILVGVAYGLGYLTAVKRGPEEYKPYD